MRNLTPEVIDEVLPQTQCGLCGYGGCMPYAKALLFEDAAINLCPPGGVVTLQTLGELLQKDPTPYIADMELKTKPEMIAVIREAECIGCMKCITACPVDAILGSAKQMHTVIAAECTGCELCVPPCPVDCIDMISSPAEKLVSFKEEKKILARKRFNTRQKRIMREKEIKKIEQPLTPIMKRKHYIQEAIARAKAKKIASTP